MLDKQGGRLANCVRCLQRKDKKFCFIGNKNEPYQKRQAYKYCQGITAADDERRATPVIRLFEVAAANHQPSKGHRSLCSGFLLCRGEMVIEVDGSGHYTDEKRKADAERDEQLAKMGISVVRYSNSDIQRKFNQVCADILQHIQAQA